jgi:hypothetical protein
VEQCSEVFVGIDVAKMRNAITEVGGERGRSKTVTRALGGREAVEARGLGCGRKRRMMKMRSSSGKPVLRWSARTQPGWCGCSDGWRASAALRREMRPQ